MPKDFQISQYDQPIDADGWLELPDGHPSSASSGPTSRRTPASPPTSAATGASTAPTYSLVDYNRAGVPLLEIVSRPDLRIADGRPAYVAELRAILVATGVSDGKMEEGSMRVDANVSVRRVGPTTLRHPLRDQEPQLAAVARAGHRVRGPPPGRPARGAASRCARRPATGTRTTAARTRCGSKEEADDYRYFPEPDLVPLDPDRGVDRPGPGRAAGAAGGAPRRAGRARPASTLPHSGVALVVERGQDDQALAAIEAGADPARVLVHVEQNLAADGGAALAPERLAALVGAGDRREAHRHAGQDRARRDAHVATPSPEDIAAAKGFEAMDTGAMVELVDGIIADHPDEWASLSRPAPPATPRPRRS